MCNPFGGGGGSSPTTSTTASTSSNQTTVNVTSNTSVPFSLNTADLADAIKALAGEQFVSSVVAAKAQVASAQLGAGPSWSTIIIVAGAILGLAFSVGFIKLPRELRA